MVRVVLAAGLSSVCQSLLAAWKNSARWAASVTWVGTGLLDQLALVKTGDCSVGWTNGATWEINRAPLTKRGEPSKFRRSTSTGTMGALMVVVPPSSGRLPLML